MYNLNREVMNLAGDVQPNTFAVLLDDAEPKQDYVLSVEQLDRLEEITGQKALFLNATQSPEFLNLPLNELDVIAIEFAAFADGRGYSFATLLRRQGFKGDLRAVGDVFKDVLFYLKRSGFTSFVLTADKNLDDAKQGLETFSTAYQASTNNPYTHYQVGEKL